jgi:hypothetical protein
MHGEDAPEATLLVPRDKCDIRLHDWYRLPDYDGYRAGCSCGWESQAHSTLMQLLTEVRDHLAE